MKVLAACEESQEVCKAFRALGHEAYSCDIIECSGGHPEWHIQDDVLKHLEGWDMIIAFPPCTHLAVSGAIWFEQKRKDGRQQQGIDFFMKMINAPCDKIAVENPIGIMSSHYRKPDQIIQPWQFALSENENTIKSTCLWLKGLSKLKPLYTIQPEVKYVEWIDKKTGRRKRQTKWYYDTRCAEHKNRGQLASKTFPGIAKAMAEQWGGNINE